MKLVDQRETDKKTVCFVERMVVSMILATVTVVVIVFAWSKASKLDDKSNVFVVSNESMVLK
jgi:hypothetical protein